MQKHDPGKAAAGMQGQAYECGKTPGLQGERQQCSLFSDMPIRTKNVYSCFSSNTKTMHTAAPQLSPRGCTQPFLMKAISYESPRACAHLLLKKDQEHANSCLSGQTNSVHICICITRASQSYYSWSMSIKNTGRGSMGAYQGHSCRCSGRRAPLSCRHLQW